MDRTVPTPEQLAEVKRLFHYDAVLGQLISRTSGRPVAKNNGRYLQVRFGGRTSVAHHVVWYLHYGVWTTDVLDHMDGDGFNNSHTNLRPCDQAMNMQNLRKAKSSNKLGILGVRAHRNKFRASICREGKDVYLGLYPTAEQAHAAYVEAKRSLHPYGLL